jgi:hypothetical protein
MSPERSQKESHSRTYGRSGDNGWSRSGDDFRINIRELHKELGILRLDESKLDIDGTL